MADALAKAVDALVTVSAPQSNHCRLTLAEAAKLAHAGRKAAPIRA